MVLSELGDTLASIYSQLSNTLIVNDEILQNSLKELTKALLQADVGVRIVADFRDNVKKKILSGDASNISKKREIQKVIVEELIAILSSSRTPYVPRKGKCNVIMFVGLQGSGKTTTCTKFAYFYQRKGFKIALVCADTFRAGAFDQLKQNATKIGVPFYGSYSEPDPVKIAREGVERMKKENFDLIIVDTSGRHHQEVALFDEMRQIATAVKPDDIVFVMDSHIGQSCYDQAAAFTAAVSVGSVIITKLDGHAKGGGALSAVAATNAPIIFLGTGEHFEDFEFFNAESFVSRLLGLGDMKGLITTVAQAVPLEKQPQMLNRLAQGLFTLRDMRDQFNNVLNMGPLSHVMSMIPGVASKLIPKGWEKEGTAQIKGFLTIMDSMTNAELDGIVPMTESRIYRVAIGSGHCVQEVKFMLERYKEFSKVIGKLGKMGLGKKGMDMTQMMRNPAQLMQNIEKAVDPRILKQMKGSQNMMNMMRQFDKMENMPDVQQLLKSMGGFGG